MNEPLEMFAPAPDPALDEVKAKLRELDPDGSRWAAIVRRTYDMLYIGQETGRYKWDDLMKTERTHFGTMFEINAQREFKFHGGDETDFRIAGHQVDAKWSQAMGGWMLPPEVFGELALVATGSDQDAVWSLGLIRVTDGVRRGGENRDKKDQLSAYGVQQISWLWKDAALPPNVLLQLPSETVDRILSEKSGNKRVEALFRAAEGMLVHRNSVATASEQLDAQRRVRANGGARDQLSREGIIVLSGMYPAQRVMAETLGIPAPKSDEFVSARVVLSDDGQGALIEGRWWRRARPDEDSPDRAPLLIERKGKQA